MCTPDDVSGGVKERCAIDTRRGRERVTDPLQQIREVGSTARRARERLRVYTSKPKLLKRARERARETRRRGDWREVLQRSLSCRVEGRSRRYRFGPQPGTGCLAVHRKRNDCAACGELCQADALQTEGGRQARGTLTRQIIGGTAGRTYDEGLSRRVARAQKIAGG